MLVPVGASARQNGRDDEDSFRRRAPEEHPQASDSQAVLVLAAFQFRDAGGSGAEVVDLVQDAASVSFGQALDLAPCGIGDLDAPGRRFHASRGRGFLGLRFSEEVPAHVLQRRGLAA